MAVSTAGRLWARHAMPVTIGASIWAVLALASALQGQIFALYHGQAQDWWSSLGYSVAVFSVWGALTPVVLKAAAWIAQRSALVSRIAYHLLCLPAFVAAHTLVFVAIYWPVYGTGLTPVEMARPVLLANLDKAVFAYLALAALDHFRRPGGRRARGPESHDLAVPTAPGEGLWSRAGGSSRLTPYREIDWIAAAGDYAEVHAKGSHRLIDRSLSSLAEELPPGEFARIHRSTIVRLDRVREVRGLGRGDASVVFHNGASFRLSRRYRDNLAAHFPV